MATLTFVNDGRTIHPDDLADKIATALGLTSPPEVSTTNATQQPPSAIVVTHANISAGNQAAIQAVIDAYTLDTNRVALPPGTLGTLLNKGRQVVAPGGVNATYLGHAAIPAGTLTLIQLSAIVRILSDQLDATTRQSTSVIKALLVYIANQAQDTSGT